MPIITWGEQTIAWEDQISEQSVNDLITSMLSVKKYYAIDEIHRDVQNFLGTAWIYLNGDLMPLIEVIRQSNLPVNESVV
jgi:hypothetical protein